MSVFAGFTLPAATFPLGRALEAVPDSRIELERIVPVGESVLPFFWVTGTERDIDTFTTAARADPAIDRLTAVDRVDDRTLFRAEWTQHSDGLITGIERADATVLEATGTAVEWHLELRFPDHERIREFQQYCTTHEIELELDRIQHLIDADTSGTYGLTRIQRETLTEAYERGYFSEPREVSLEALARTLDVTERAVSRRIGRGIERLIANTIAETE